MRFDVYKALIDEQKLIFVKSDNHFEKLNLYLDNIQNEIIQLYLEKQNKEAGIKKLGNEMRYSKKLNSLFENSESEFYIVKFTENNRYFLSKFIEMALTAKQEEIFFLILGNEFGKDSKLVDGSFIRFNQIKSHLNAFFDVFQPRIVIPTFYFIEINGFTDYFFENRKGYNFIHKITKK